jgi:DNA mismatch repair protein PMS2
MKEGNSSDTVRCSKARAMFAMRACRSSIMIGTALKQRHMVNVSHVNLFEGWLLTKTLIQMVRNLAGMDLPWNCPHGRPTMRHLCNLRAYNKMAHEKPDWAAFERLAV